MGLEKVLKRIDKIPEAAKVLNFIKTTNGNCQIEGLSTSAKAPFLASLFHKNKGSLLLITHNLEEAERLAEDLPYYAIPNDKVCFYPPSDSFIHEDGIPPASAIGERLHTLTWLASGEKVVVIATISAVLRRTLPPEAILQYKCDLKINEEADITKLAEKLVALGYEHTEVVDRHGEFCKRGGLIDIFPANEDYPVRIEFFGDQIESIRHFDSSTQRSTDKLDSVSILPTREILLTEERVESAIESIRTDLNAQVKKFRSAGDGESAQRISDKVEDDIFKLSNKSFFNDIEFYLPYLEPNENTIFDYLKKDSIIIIDEPSQVKSQWEKHEDDFTEAIINRTGKGLLLASKHRHYLPLEETISANLSKYSGVLFTLLPRSFAWAVSEFTVTLHGGVMDSFNGQVESALDQIKTWADNGFSVIIASNKDKRLKEILDEHGISSNYLIYSDFEKAGCYLTHAPLRSGYKLPQAKIMVITDSEIFGMQRMHRLRKPSHEGIPISSVLDLKEGDYVVHISHGIAYYRGITTLKQNGVEREYLLLEYAGNDRIYVPTDQIDRVQKYIGGDGLEPHVHKLGGVEWARATKKVKKAVEEIAKDLVELYAWRQALQGHSYAPDTPWQQEMESAFPFNETPDQLSAINDVKADLEQPKAMDRLLCGDVGYGKTEVAVRAAFKVVSEGRQVAVLAPTTVLAHQHLNTFRERLAAFPIKVEVLSRFRSKAEQKEILEHTKYGMIDILIGTHRILSKDVEFKDLGLLVIDEEQRFGVRHKEKLKQLRKEVDVLTMTATPIPRTLHMSLIGLRDMSVINDPPEGRMPIQTIVRPAEEDLIRNAIVRELDRGGQVFFVHNRVENIGHIANAVQKLVPYARVEIAHGQMNESSLEKVMMDFYEKKFDILVCTTIIESGLDVPNANTIIINEADKLGLAQLYQLRGRVGRSDRQAYAYLVYKPEKNLSETAEKRLAAIKEFTDLGSGYRIALRDLEIRGAGNLLGSDQSGHMAAVGFDLYCQLLSKAVKELKGEEVTEIILPPVELPVDAFIPNNYMPTEAHRILFYKKMASVQTVDDVKAVQDELEDRFGDPPAPVWNMLAILRLRIRCYEIGISSINIFQNQINVNFATGVRISQDICKELMKTHKRHWFQPDKLVINPSSRERVISEVEDLVEVLAGAIKKMKKELAV
ncbi:MAG: transcription-repair coupling factor [Armatimonadota bacterium]